MVYHMKLDESVTPVICSARKIPMAMRDGVIKELKTYGQPEKKDSSIRLCIDPVHLNKALLRPHHPVRTMEDILSNMPNTQVFTILDAKANFWQVPLDEESSLLTSFISLIGRYKFLRMPYGIKTATEVFQCSIVHLFTNQPCEIVVDDILVYGHNQDEHDKNLKKVLDRARRLNLKLNPQKYKFQVNNVPFVGHILTSKQNQCY